MAFTAREVIMTFRGQNYLSSAIRRVGRDVGALSRTTQLQQQRAALQVASQRAANSLAINRAEQMSIVTGTRALALQARGQQLKTNELQQLERINVLSQQGAAIQREQIVNNEELLRLQEAQKAGVPFVGRGTGRMATNQAMQAAMLRQEELASRMASLQNEKQAILNSTMEKGSIEAQKLAASYAELDARLGQLIAQEQAQIDAQELINTKLRQNAVAMRMLPWEKFAQGARAVEHAGRVLQMFGLISTAVFGYGAEQAAKFATQTTLAATQVVDVGNRSVRNVQQVSQEINNALSQFLAQGQTTAKPEELTKGIYDIYSSISLPGGQKARAQEGINLLKQYNQVLTANYGFVQFDDVVRAGNILINDFGYNVKTIGPALNTMQAAVRFGNMNMGQFVSTFNQAAPAAKSAGYSFTQMADAITFLSRKMPSIRMAATGYARLVEVLAKSTDAFKAQGVTITDAHGKLLPLDQVIERLVKRWPQLASGGNTFFQNFFKNITGQSATIQARRVFTFLAQGLQDYRKLSQQVNKDNNELARSAVAAGTSPGVAWAKFTNQLRGLVLLIGQGAIPAFAAMGKPIERVLQWFSQLSPHTQRLIGYLGAIVSVGALVGGTIMVIAGGIGTLIAEIGKMVTHARFGGEGGILARILGTGTVAGSGEAGFITATLAMRIGLVALIPLALKYHTQIDHITRSTIGWKNAIDLLSLAMLAVPFLRFVKGLRTAEAAAALAEGKVGALQGALLGLGSMGPITISILLKFLSAGLPELPAAGDALKVLEGKDPFAAPGSNTGTLAASKLVQAAQRGNDDLRKLLYDRNSITGAATKVARRFGSETPYEIIQRFWGVDSNGNTIPAAKRINQATFNKFAENLLRVDPALAKKVLGHTIGRMDVITGNVDARPAMRGAQAQTNFVNARAQDIRNANKKIVEAQKTHTLTVQDWISKVERASARKLANPGDLAAAKAYETVQAQLNKHFKGQPQLLAAINDVLSNYDSNLKKSADSAKTLGVTFQDVLQGVQNMYQNFQQQESGLMGTIFNGPFVNNPLTQNRLQWGGRLSGMDLLRDARSQLHQFTRFHGQLDNLRRRGAPNELINQLMAAGDSTDNMRNIAALQSLNPTQLREYFRAFDAQQNAIKQYAMRDLQNQLKMYRKHGQNIAKAIIAGLRDENVSLTNALTKMVRRMFPGLPVGATGAGGRATHHPPAQKVDVNVKVDHGKENNTPHITKKAKQGHDRIRKQNKHPVPFGGPR